MKILLAVDGSKNAIDATVSLIKHTDWFREKPAVRLLTVHLPVPKVGGMGAVVSHEMVQRYYDEEGRKMLADAEVLLKNAGITFSSGVLVGDIAALICAEAEKEKCDMIWMGTRGMSAAANVFMGSVATKVLHAAKMPVTLVK